MRWQAWLPLVLLACASGPEPIRWGVDTCAQCRMVLSDRRFGATWATPVRSYPFDEVAELERWRRAHPAIEGRAYVTDGVAGGLVPAEQAVYLASPDLHGPMGGQVMSFRDRTTALQAARAAGWRQVRLMTYPELRRDEAP